MVQYHTESQQRRINLCTCNLWTSSKITRFWQLRDFPHGLIKSLILLAIEVPPGPLSPTLPKVSGQIKRRQKKLGDRTLVPGFFLVG